MQSSVKRTVKVSLGFLLTVVLFWFLFRKLDFQSFAEYLKKGNKLLILLGILLYISSFAIRGLRWKVIIGKLADFKLCDLSMFTVSGYAINNILPVRLGEFARAWIAGNGNTLGASGALATIFVERVFDGLTITLILVVTLLAYPFQAEMQQIALIAAAIFGALFCFIIFGTFSDIPLRILRFFRSKSPKFALFLFDIAEKFLNGAATLRSFKRIAAVLLLSFAVWAVELSLYLLVSSAFDVNIPFAGYLVMLCAANLGMLAAPTPGGLGVFQSAIVLALESFAIVYEKRMAVALIIHLSQIVPITIIGIIWLNLKGISISGIVKEEKSAD